MNLAEIITGIFKVLDVQIALNRRDKSVFSGVRISKITAVFYV
jgi:hypothetical protein